MIFISSYYEAKELEFVCKNRSGAENTSHNGIKQMNVIQWLLRK